MKGGQFVSKNIFQKSAYSLNKYSEKNIDQKVDKISQEFLINKQQQLNKKNINQKYHSGSTKETHKTEEQLQRHIKCLQSQLKRKVCENASLTKFFRTKNSSQLSHIDIYLQLTKLQRVVNEKKQESDKVKQMIEIQDKQHLAQIQQLSKKITKFQINYKQKLSEKEQLYQEQTIQRQTMYEQNQLLLKQLNKKNTQLTEKIKQLEEQIRIQEYAQQMQKLQLQENYEEIIDKQKQQNQKYILKIKQLTIINEKLSQQIEQYQQKQISENNNNKLQIIMNDLQQKNYNEKKQIQNIHEKYVEQLHQQLNQKQKLINQLNYENQNQKEQNQINKIEVSNSKQQVQQLRGQMQLLNQQIEAQKDQLDFLKRDLNNRSKNLQCIEKKHFQQVKQKNKLLEQIVLYEDKIIKINSQLKILSYQKDEHQAILNKYKQEKNKFLEDISKLQSKLFTKTRQYDSCLRKNNEYELNIQHLQQINNKQQNITVENYKTIGRIIELNHKISKILPNNLQITSSKQELTDVITELTENIHNFIDECYFVQIKEINKYHLCQKEILIIFQNVLSSISTLIKEEECQQMIKKFIKTLKETSNNTDEEIQNQRINLSNKIHDFCLNIKAIRYYNSENSTKNFDSLQRTNKDNSRYQKNKNIQEYQENIRKKIIFTQSLGQINQRKFSIKKQNINILNNYQKSNDFIKKQQHNSKCNISKNNNNWNNKQMIQNKYFRN